MEFSFWIKVTGKPIYAGSKTRRAGPVSASRSKPTTNPSEVAFKLEVDIPDSFFERPELVAQIKIPSADQRPAAVNAETLERVAEELTKATGFNVTVSAAEEGATT